MSLKYEPASEPLHISVIHEHFAPQASLVRNLSSLLAQLNLPAAAARFQKDHAHQ